MRIPCDLCSSLCTLRLTFVRFFAAVETADNAPQEDATLDTGGGLNLTKLIL